MVNFEDYFGGLSEEEYIRQTKEHLDFIRHICMCDDEKAYYLLDKFKESLFSCEFVSDEEANMLYHTFLNWKDKADMHDNLQE